MRLLTRLALVVLLTAPALPAVPAAANAEPIFQVGAAVRSVSPATASQATHVGGFGDCLECAANGTTKIRRGDDLDARAVYIRSGGHAVVLASVPLEGWFAGYQEGARLGITELRQEAAAALSALPGAAPVAAADIIVNSNHCHSCPTVVGIWANTNPAYLRRVYDQTLAAIIAAGRAARAAGLRWATADIGYVNDVTVGQANANEGWPVDGQLSVLQAKDAKTGRVIATYASVPAHGNVGFGPDLAEMNSEHFGAAARWLEAHQGGIGIVSAATLGDQTTPMQGDDTRLPRDPRRPYPPARPGNRTPIGFPRAYDVIDRLGALTGSTAVEALQHHGHVMTSSQVLGAESYQVVPADNPLLLGLIYGHALPDGIPFVTHDGQFAGQRTADRSVVPPYAVGPGVGVWFTTLRIGDIAVASEPGEAFPHVTQAIREVLTGAAATFVVGNAQDQLGYYYEVWAYPGTFYYSADHYLYNVGPTLAQQNIQAELLNGRALGFAVNPAVSSLTGAAENDYTRYFRQAGIQVWAYPQGRHDVLPRTASSFGLPIGVYWNEARGSENGLPGGEVPTGPPVVTFDGRRVAVTGAKTQFASVPVTCLGDHVLTATLPGTSQSWRAVVHVHAPDDVTNTASYPSGTGSHPLASQNAHDGVSACAAAAPKPVSGPRSLGQGASPGRLPATGLPDGLAVCAAALLLAAVVAGRGPRRRAHLRPGRV
ncbi:MAG: hypothetical protein NVSMB55_23400 [Mycobacteriales bacterium]